MKKLIIIFKDKRRYEFRNPSKIESLYGNLVITDDDSFDWAFPIDTIKSFWMNISKGENK